MAWNTAILLSIISALVLWIVVLLRQNSNGGCTFQLHQLSPENVVKTIGNEVTKGFLAATTSDSWPKEVAPAAPAAPAVPAVPSVAPVRVSAKGALVLAYARFPKTGSRYAIEKMHAVIGKDLKVIAEAEPVKTQALEHAFVVGSVRNPCESYLSLWAFQSDPQRKVGLMVDLKKRHPEAYARLVGQDASSNFTTPQDVRRFREWVRFLANDRASLGLLSGRFHGKYLATAEVNMRDNAMLVKDLSLLHATQMAEALQAMDVDKLADCWLHTETMDEDLQRCLKLYQERGGRVDTKMLSASPVKGSSHHGNCKLFFDAETERLVRQLDAPMFSKFGYDTCCVPDVRSQEPTTPRPSTSSVGSISSAPSTGISAWSWGDPFDQAGGRPTKPHSGKTMWKARVGPCDRSVPGPNERELSTENMLTLPTIRMALDDAILACLQTADLTANRTFAQLMMYQGVLSGLYRSCAFLARRLDFSPTEPFTRKDIKAIFTHWSSIMPGAEPEEQKKLSIFKLTGFSERTWTHGLGRNLAQLAVWMGHAELVTAVLGRDAYSTVMDPRDATQRTLRDYLSAPGCPVYNWPMADAIANAVSSTAGRYRVERPPPTGLLKCNGYEYPELSLGWTEETTWDHYHACDFEVVDALSQTDFEEKFRNLGRPVLVKNFADAEDRCDLRKGLVLESHKKQLFDLGPIAYPRLIGASPCEKQFTVEEAEKGAICQRHGNTSNYHASHDPGLAGKDLRNTKTFAKVKGVLPRLNHLSRQYFWGGDRSGAALHYHVAAFNVLFIGEKEWYVTPPYLAARSGIATEHLFARSGVNQNHLFRCTQYAGDLVLLPDGWGHATLNHGFGMGIGVLYDETD